MGSSLGPEERVTPFLTSLLPIHTYSYPHCQALLQESAAAYKAKASLGAEVQRQVWGGVDIGRCRVNQVGRLGVLDGLTLTHSVTHVDHTLFKV